MTTTPAMPELPEPELGYIETDKSNQPAFSARQMRAALQSAQPAEAVSDESAKYVEQIMEQAQVFASAWSLVGGRFDFGNALDDANEAKDELRALVARAILALRPQAVPMTEEPFLKVHKGEICYKSDADDQSYGMWCPVNWDTEHGFSDGTVFYAHHGITQRADGGEG